MSFELWLAFVITSSALVIIPGPTILTVISYALKHGPKATATLVLAVALGDAVAVTLSLFGLGALLAASSALFSLVKIIGGLYLIYLGVKFLLHKPTAINSHEPLQQTDGVFLNTFIVTALNPKGIIFFVAFLPQFIDTEAAATPQLIIMAITFVILGAVNCAMYSLLASRATQQLQSPKTRRYLNFTGGSLLSLAGVWTLNSEL